MTYPNRGSDLAADLMTSNLQAALSRGLRARHWVEPVRIPLHDDSKQAAQEWLDNGETALVDAYLLLRKNLVSHGLRLEHGTLSVSPARQAVVNGRDEYYAMLMWTPTQERYPA